MSPDRPDHLAVPPPGLAPPPTETAAPAAPAPGAPGGGPGWATSGGRPPNPATVFVAVYKLLLRSIATPGRLVAIGALAAVAVVTALGVHASDPFDPLRSATGYAAGSLSTLVPVAVLVFGAAALGDLVDDGTLVYLWLRPVPPRIYLAAAWAATVTITIPLVAAPMLLAAMVIEPSGDLFVGILLGALVAIAAYSALFVTAGIRFRRALPWGLVYILIWEGFVASAGETAAKLAIRSYVRSILSEATGIRIKLGTFSTWVSVVVPLLVTIALLAYGSRRLARTDVA